MKNFFEIADKNSTIDNPSDLVGAYIDHESASDKNTLYSFLSQYDFDAREDIEAAVRRLAKAVAGDAYLNNKERLKANILYLSISRRYTDIATKLDKYNKYPAAVASELWHGGYSRMMLNNRIAKFYEGVVPDANKFADVCTAIKQIYNLSDNDINKLHFFVEQVKAGAAFPNSLRRMLYIWGTSKKTGKTTSATMLTTLLNGDTNEHHIAKYSTSLSNEMQIGSFKVPLISECSVCMMDECFYADMGKTYADFKRFMTGANGTARLPYGQSFAWEGQPNYIATSNDPLRKFIKDWDDRRYLSIEFVGKPTARMSFEDIKELWRLFVVNSTCPKDWQAWADELAPLADEVGERQERADEFILELQQPAALEAIFHIDNKNDDSPRNPANRLSLKWFVDYFATHGVGATEANKRRGEIEAAVVAVFGERYSTTRCWLVNQLKTKAAQIKYNNPDVTAEDEKLPF